MNHAPQATPASAAEDTVFERLGCILRSLHDTLREIGAHTVLAEAASEFPSARERLLHIGRLTEKAANTVLTRVEEVAPVQTGLAEQAQTLMTALADPALAGQLPAALQPLFAQLTGFVTQAHVDCSTTRNALSDIMMAQDFQDLTGQLIKKVVFLLEHTENDLLRLLIDAAPPDTVVELKKEEVMAGPGAPGAVALEQTDVDDLLSDLGF